MEFKEGDEVVLCDLKPGQFDYYNNGDEGVIIDVCEIQIMVRFRNNDYWWFDECNLELNKRSIRDRKLKELGI
jgi:hypothetical protein